MNLFLVVGLVLAQDPFVDIAEKDANFSSFYNAKQFDAVANLYHPDALLLAPDMPSDFVKQPQISGFFKAAYQSGLHPIKLAPYKVEPQNGILHEIGTLNGNQGMYYVRWIPDDSVGWLIAFDCMAIGGHGGEARNATSSNHISGGRLWKQPTPGPIGVLAKIYESFIDIFNDGNIEGAYTFLFSEDNRCIFQDGRSLNDRESTIRAVQSSNIKMISVAPLHVYEESETLWHEIGQNAFVSNGKKVGMFYYSRWERSDSSAQWKSTFFIQGIGD